MAVWHGREDGLSQPLREEPGPPLLEGRTEEPRAAGEAEEVLCLALGTAHPGEASAGDAAVEEGRHGILDHRPEGAVLGLEALLVDAGELRKVVVDGVRPGRLSRYRAGPSRTQSGPGSKQRSKEDSIPRTAPPADSPAP